MAIINNPRFRPGETITAPLLNAKFTDIVTATTAALDGLNLRNEAVDLPNLDFNGSSGQSGIILVDAREQDNNVGTGAGATYVSTDRGVGQGDAPQELTHGAGTRIVYAGGKTLEDGDILRVYWNVLVGDFARVSLATLHPCWVIWPQWDITDATLTNWEAIPDQVDFDDSFAADATAPKGARADTHTPGTMVIPHGMTYYKPVAAADTELDHENMSATRSQHYLHSGADIKVYGLRVVLDGLYYPRYSLGAININRLAHRDTDPDVGNDKVVIKAAWVTALIMRTT